MTDLISLQSKGLLRVLSNTMEPTKVHLVKAMVFPVVMYRCKRWTIKMAKCLRIHAFKLWCLEKTLESLLDCKEIKSVNPKGDQL